MQLTVLNHPDGSILAVKNDTDPAQPSIITRMTTDNLPYVMPRWCSMGLEDHAFAWGCMGVGHGLVAKEGRNYCRSCEFYSPLPTETITIVTDKLERFSDYELHFLGMDVMNYSPVFFPCYAVVYRHAMANKYGGYDFKSEVMFIYEEWLFE